MFFQLTGRDAQIIGDLPQTVHANIDNQEIQINHLCLPPLNSVSKMPKSCHQIQAIPNFDFPIPNNPAIFQKNTIQQMIGLDATNVQLIETIEIDFSKPITEIKNNLIEQLQMYHYLETLPGSSSMYFKGVPKLLVYWGKTEFASLMGLNLNQINSIEPNEKLLVKFKWEDAALNTYIEEKTDKEPIIAIFALDFKENAIIHHTLPNTKNWRGLTEKLLVSLHEPPLTNVKSIKFTNPLLNDIIKNKLRSKSEFNEPISIAAITDNIDLRPNFFMLYCNVIEHCPLNDGYERIIGLISSKQQEFFSDAFKGARITTKNFDRIIFEIRDPENNLVKFDKGNDQIGIAFSIGRDVDVCGKMWH